MKRKIVVWVMLTLLILSMLTLAFNIRPVNASGTIYIRADGSVGPPDAPISSVDNITYTFTDNIYDEIVVERSNIIIDGNGHTLESSKRENGFYLYSINNVTIQNTNIRDCDYGIHLYASSYNVISRNNITNNRYGGIKLIAGSSNNYIFGNNIRANKEFGIYLNESSYNMISGNRITNNWKGIYLYESSKNRISGNRITKNWKGIYLYGSSNNTISGNIVTNNWKGIYLNKSSGNTISGNSITNNWWGIYLYRSSNNTISGNRMTKSAQGVFLASSSNNILSRNYIMNNWAGVSLFSSESNSIYHNNFIANTQQVYILTSGYTNLWDNGYPSGGNYWSDYTGFDANRDGIGDMPYVIDENNQDNYPLMEPWTPARSTQYPWPMFHHNLRRTGYTESPAPRTNQTLWNYKTGGGVWSSPSVAYGMIFVGSNDGNVYALDQHTGAHVWNYTIGIEVHSSPAVADGKVYVGSCMDKVYCLDASTGAHIWNYTTGGIESSPAVADGKVYVGSHDGRVYCLNASTGAHIWNYTIGDDAAYSSPAVAYGKVYVGSLDDKIYCLDASTGTFIWSYTTGGDVQSSPAVAYGNVYVGSKDDKVYCLDASTGAFIWSYKTGDDVWSSPAVAYGKAYIGSLDGRVYCLDASTGAHIWNYTTGDWVVSSPAVADGKVFVGSLDNKTYCLDASTGDFIWSYKTGGPLLSPPAVADGILFIGSQDNAVYAIGNIVRVPEDYSTITEAIDAATPGATIIIASGTYHEDVVVDKPLTILGKTNSTTEFEGGGSGIAITLLPGASGSTVTEVVITNWDQGILVKNSSDSKIYNNIMSLMGSSGIALEGDNATNNLIYSNIFQDNAIAIDLTESSTSNTIYANTITENEVGIAISNSNGNIIYHNSFVNNIENARSEGLSNVWDNGYPSGGNYWSDQTGTDDYRGPNQDQPGSDGIYDMAYSIDANNEDNYPLTKPYGGPYDIGITNIATSKTVVGQGYNIGITVKTLNYGMYSETFTLTVYANTIIMTTQTITLTRRNSTIITFTWSTTGVPYGNYAVSANAAIVPGETYTTDNTYTDGWIVVTIPGDVNGDYTVDIYDAITLATAFGSKPDDTNWNPNADITGDDTVDIYDAIILAGSFGETV